MQEYENNEISRKILSYLNDSSPKAIKFSEMVQGLNAEEKVLFKNLFFLEENSFVQLMSSYPTGATYPTIHMVKIRDEGKSLLEDEDKLNALFPLQGLSSRLDLYHINSLTVSEIVNNMLVMIEKGEIAVEKNKETLLKALNDLSAEPEVSEIKLEQIFESLTPSAS